MNNKKIITLNLYMIFFILIVGITNNIINLEYYEWIKYFSVLVIISLIVQHIFMKIDKIPNISLATMFISLGYLFHFGQILLLGLIPHYKFKGYHYMYEYNYDIFKKSSTFSLLVLLLVGFGMMLVTKSYMQKRDIYNNLLSKNIYSYKRIAIILIIIFFPIQLYLDINKIINSINSGYLSTFADMGSGDGILSVFGYLGFMGFALLIMIYSELNKRKAFIMYLIINVYLVFTMSSGGRGHQITLMLLFLYIEHKCIYKVRLKNLAIIGIAGYALIVFLNAITIFRNEGIQSITQLRDAIEMVINENPILKLVEEMGGSARTPYLVFEQVPSLHKPTLGMTYLNGFITLIPNVGGIFTEAIKSANFQSALKVSGIGGSFIGELYFNFQYFGILIAPLVGFMIRKISIEFDLLLKHKNFLIITCCIPIFTYLLWWVRGTAYSVLRPFVWNAIIIYLLYKIFYRKSKSNI